MAELNSGNIGEDEGKGMNRDEAAAAGVCGGVVEWDFSLTIMALWLSSDKGKAEMWVTTEVLLGVAARVETKSGLEGGSGGLDGGIWCGELGNAFTEEDGKTTTGGEEGEDVDNDNKVDKGGLVWVHSGTGDEFE